MSAIIITIVITDSETLTAYDGVDAEFIRDDFLSDPENWLALDGRSVGVEIQP